MEFLHFIALTKESFQELVAQIEENIKGTPVEPWSVRPSAEVLLADLKRRKFASSEIVEMTLKYLTSKAKLKDLCPQFGTSCTTFRSFVRLGMEATLDTLINHPKVYGCLG